MISYSYFKNSRYRLSTQVFSKDTPDLRLIWIPLIQKRTQTLGLEPWRAYFSSIALANGDHPNDQSTGGVNRRRSNPPHYMGNLAARMLKRLKIRLGGHGMNSSWHIRTLTTPLQVIDDTEFSTIPTTSSQSSWTSSIG
ncbi:hypothetical protein D9613_011907 [Agrocybe pediades]|uniref:Uncharacterized protein n=1 Tax=Agrocybe pediades TaxID=84607 RepID=A0A8H4QF25_9AGAR|nr:hypothetical protein D9613_011907 [Agrocybe pediades]